MDTFTLTKRIAKQGDKSIIVIPSFLHGHIKPGDVARIEIKLLRNIEEVERK